jgi:hypothetical protein
MQVMSKSTLAQQAPQGAIRASALQKGAKQQDPSGRGCAGYADENAFLHLKRWRGIATRYAKNLSPFPAAVHIRCVAIGLQIL